MHNKSNHKFFVFSISILLLGCYPNYRWEGNRSFYIDKKGVKHYVKLYYKGIQITQKGRNGIDSVYEIKWFCIHSLISNIILFNIYKFDRIDISVSDKTLLYILISSNLPLKNSLKSICFPIVNIPDLISVVT